MLLQLLLLLQNNYAVAAAAFVAAALAFVTLVPAVVHLSVLPGV